MYAGEKNLVSLTYHNKNKCNAFFKKQLNK